MDVFPAALPLHGRRVVVAGDGEMADAKARLFLGSPAELVRVPAASALDPQSYAGARLAFIALPGEAAAQIAAQAAALARAAGAWVNVVDRPELCDFTTPALVDRGQVVGAIMTGGAAPVLATELRLALEAQWPPGLGRVAALLERLKPELRGRLPDPAARRRLLRTLVRGPAGAAALEGRLEEAEILAHAALTALEPTPPRIALIRAPAAPDLISLRALRRLSEADRIVADAGVDPELARLGRRDAPLTWLSAEQAAAARIDGGATLTPWLAPAGLLVRLCRGDPQQEYATLSGTTLVVEITD
jgi:precorrin-2 dehydrogenase/sirohydrochlorin ferrochelatase